MERTESMVVQVAPDYENEKIQEMQTFGWNLQGRQEIHEEGQAEGRPSITGSSYVIKTTVHQYVKLHFIRSANLPNLDRIKALESQYFSVPFPTSPSFRGAGCFTLFGIMGVLVMLMSLGQPGSPGGGGLVMFFVWTGIGIFWLKSKLSKRTEAEAAYKAGALRRSQLKTEAQALL